eukprot:350463-Chlamydomonas_euryale.AAC.3
MLLKTGTTPRATPRATPRGTVVMLPLHSRTASRQCAHGCRTSVALQDMSHVAASAKYVARGCQR